MGETAEERCGVEVVADGLRSPDGGRREEKGDRMKKRVRIAGEIELPDGAELPPIGAKVYASVVAEVEGDHTDRLKRRGGRVERVHTAPSTIVEGSEIERFELPEPDPELPLNEDGDDGGD